MNPVKRIAVAAGLLALTATGSNVRSAFAQSNVVGHVYVNDNTTGVNTIGAFDRHADGTLTSLAGSPFAAGGTGTGTGIGSQGALQLSGDGRYLLAADAGSSQISVLRIAPNGSLSPAGPPVWSGGAKPVSLAVHQDLVYVANSGDPAPNFSGFTLNPGGQLRPLENSTAWVPAGSTPSDVLFNSTGTNLVGALVGPAFSGPSFIASYAVGSDGRLTPALHSPFPAQAPGTIGSEFRPTNPAQLFVSNAHAGPGLGSVSAYDVAADGTLNPIGASPYADNQTAPCWVEISHDGQYLFAVNTASNSISRYAIATNGSLALLGSTPFNDGSASRATDARLDPNGGHLYIVNPGANAVSIFAVSGANLTEDATSPAHLPAGAAPVGIAVN